MATDDIRALSEALAADPSSLAFLPLGEALRRRGDLDVALRVALRGAERHPTRADAHDLVARISADRGEMDHAIAEWETVLRLDPAHAGALKGLGFVCFQLGRLEDAYVYLGSALNNDSEDGSLAAALETVRHALEAQRANADRATVEVRRVAASGEYAAPVVARESVAAPLSRPMIGLPVPEPVQETDTASLFDDLLEGQRSAALLLDDDGLVLAGRYIDVDGVDRAADIGAQLSGVSDEAARAMRHLGLGAWKQIVFETEAASVAMAPANDGVLLVAAARPIPLGFVRRVLDRAVQRAAEWIGGLQ